MKESSFRTALWLLEEAIAVARKADALSWLVYLGGVVPFFGVLLYEITNVQQNPFAGEQVLALAFVLAVLFFWMHICQAVFCTRLYSIHSETESKLGQAFQPSPTSAGCRCRNQGLGVAYRIGLVDPALHRHDVLSIVADRFR